MAKVRENRFFSTSKPRNASKTTDLLVMANAIKARGTAFEDTQFSVAKQSCTETTDDLGYVNAFRWCPPVLGYRRKIAFGIM